MESHLIQLRVSRSGREALLLAPFTLSDPLHHDIPARGIIRAFWFDSVAWRQSAVDILQCGDEVAKETTQIVVVFIER